MRWGISFGMTIALSVVFSMPASGKGKADRVFPAETLLVGMASADITPRDFETFEDLNHDHLYQAKEEPFYDYGVDRLQDVDEPGAFGADGAPGRAGIDDDGNGVTDDRSEYLAPGSDDVPDPNGDNYHRRFNRTGTEGDGKFQVLYLAGFDSALLNSPGRAAQGIHDDLFARAVVLSKGSEHLIVVSLDLIGLFHQYINPIKRRIESAIGVPFDRIVIASTHSHETVDTMGIWAGNVDPAYQQKIMDQTFAAVIRAWERRRPARMKSVSVEPLSCMEKETLRRKRASECRFPDYDDGRYNHMDQAPEYDLPLLLIDTRDPIVRSSQIRAMLFEDLETGETIGTLVNWTNHPETVDSGNNLISADFVKYVRDRMEAVLGGTCAYFSGEVGGLMTPLRGTPAPLWNEAGEIVWRDDVRDADGNPVPVLVGESGFDKARSVGYEVAQTAIDALAQTPFTPDPELSVETEDLDIVIENPMFKALALLLTHQPGVDPRDKLVRAPYCGLIGCIRTQITVATVGDARIVTAPGEILPEYVIGRHASVAPYSEMTGGEYEDAHFPAMPSIAANSGKRDTFVFGLANHELGYMVPASDTLPLYDTEHPNYYEESVSTGKHYGDTVGNKILEMLGSEERFSDDPTHP